MITNKTPKIKNVQYKLRKLKDEGEKKYKANFVEKKMQCLNNSSK